jgi:Xaa-Pro aminopeptidase
MATSQELLARLAPMDFSARIEAVRSQLGSLDSLVVTHLTNVRYLTGYTGSNGTVVITKDSVSFITDGRYRTQSKEQLAQAGVDAEIYVTSPGQNNYSYLEKALSGLSSTGFEADTLSYSSAMKFINHFPSIDCEPTSQLVESIRIVKQPGEVDRIRAACRIADEALAEVSPMLTSLPTEKEFAEALDRMMKDLGAEGNSFDTIVACGQRAALPHAVPTDARIEPNQMIVIDFGCVVDGYCSDMTRTLSVGEVDHQQQEMFDQVMESQKRGREYARAGVTAGDVDDQCRSYLDEQGVGEYFAHGTGHGVGLDIHEAPRVGSNVSEVLEPGYIVTVEPGIYIEGVAGVRIEDTLCITDDGAEVLTSAPKELVV